MDELTNATSAQEQNTKAEASPAPRKRGFKPGHPKYGGRKKGSPIKRTAEAREIADKLGFHPVEFLAKVVMTGKMPNPDGTETIVTPQDRLDAAKAIAPYILPKLAQTAVTGANDGPVAVDLDVTKLLSDPESARAAQALALKLAAAHQAQDE